MDQFTRHIGRISHPLDGFGSHTLNSVFSEMGINAAYLQFGGPDTIGMFEAMKTLGFCGATIRGQYTHGKSVIDLVDEIDPHARRVGSINTIRIRSGATVGYRTTGQAIVDLMSRQMNLNGAHVAVLGNGIITRDVCDGLPEQGANVAIFSRNAEAGKALAQEFSVEYGGEPSALSSRSKIDAFINATPIGTTRYATREIHGADAICSRAGMIVELTINPWDTPLVETANRHGVPVISGPAIYAAQAARQIELWLDVKADLDLIERHAKEEIMSFIYARGALRFGT